MATDTNAPTHHAVNGHVPVGAVDRDVEVRAPALALHSDHETTSPYDTDPQKKNRGWFHWRAHGMPSVVFTMRDLTHGEYGQGDVGPVDETGLRRLQWYTRAWFDVFLKRDRRAYRRLLARRSSARRAPRCSARSSRRRRSCPRAGSTARTCRQPCEGL